MAASRESLSDMETRWSLIFRAQETKGDTAAQARSELLAHYHGAVQSYFRRALGPRREYEADQLYSNFAVRILELDPLLKRVKKLHGKHFRHYLRTALWRMVKDYQRKAARGKQFIEGSDQDRAAPLTTDIDEEQVFYDCWRQELINQTWRAMEQLDKRVGKLYVALLQMQQEQPNATYAQMAEQLGARMGQSFTPTNVRQLVHRGRDLFAELLVRETARSLKSDGEPAVSAEKLEQELIELKLLFK